MRFICKFFVLYTLITFIGATRLSAFDLKNGDLVFQANGQSEMSEAIAVSTTLGDTLDFVHVGIISVIADSIPYVIEASPSAGVRMIKFKDFIHDGMTYVVKRLNTPFDWAKTHMRAMKYMGKPYDWAYLPDNDSIYCSELVYLSFVDENEKPVFSTKPMNFRDKNGEMPTFWINLYSGLGLSVPEGVEGTNPNDMANDSRLMEVLRITKK